MRAAASDTELLGPYLPRLVRRWLAEPPERTSAELDGTLVLADVAGFTSMSDRLARAGRIGAEEVAQTIGRVFATLLELAYAGGGELLKFGGDALLLFFDGDGHALRAARAANEMTAALGRLGPIATSAGRFRLRMSVGATSGPFSFFLVGDSHRELVVAGPAATEAVGMEALASGGEVVVSRATADRLPARMRGAPRETGFLLRRAPVDEAPGPVDPPGDDPAVDLSRGIPASLRAHLLDGAGDAEHRHAAVGFVRFEGVDALLAAEGTCEAAERIEAIVGAAQRAAERNGVTFLGTDVDRDGGKIILVAGAPSATGDEEERLVLTARELAATELPLAVRVGLNRGHVFAGDVGPPFRRTFTVMGAPVNLAARLMASAAPGQILATGAVLDRTLTAFHGEPLPPLALKGKAHPVQAFAVGSRLGARSDGRPLLPLLGRERETEALARALAGARAGRGRVLEVAGPPGIGKTRLLAELCDRADGCAVHLAHCDLYTASTPYAAIGRLMRAVLDVPSSADETQAELRLRARVGERAPDLAPWLPLVGTALGLALEPTPEVEELADEFRKARLEETVVELLSRVLDAPTILAFEDVHWMDEASADLLARLAATTPGRPWVVCVTRRDAETGFVAPAAARTERLRPSPLRPEEASALLAAATEDEPLRPHVAAALAERSGGNPLFLQELLRSARAGGEVTRLPDSIEALVVAQIDRLAPADRRLLRYASVLGTTFADDLLAPLLGEPPDPRAWSRLDDFVQDDGAGARRFRHALIRDAAYEGLPYSRRRELHGRAGEALVRRADEAPVELLALHFFHAQRYDDAWRYSRAAGDRARAAYANVDAADAYGRALEAARRAGGVDAADAAAVLEALAEVTDRVGAYEEATRALRAARKLVGADPVVAARLLRREAEIAERSGGYVKSLRLLGRGLSRLEGVAGPDAARERAKLCLWYGSGRMRQGRHREAARWCGRAVVEAERAGDREALAWAYMVLDTIHVELGTLPDRPYGALALAIFEELGDLSRQATMALNLGGRAYYESRWSDALASYERARELYTRTGNTVGAADATFNIAELLSQQGRLEEAESLLRDVERVWRAAGDRIGVALAESELARVAYGAGRWEEALPRLERLRDRLRAAGADGEARETEVRMAECLVLAGEPGPALALLDAALERARAGGELAGVRVSRLQRLRGTALLQEGRRDEARAAFAESVGAGRADGTAYEVALSLDGLARLARETGDAEADGLAEESGALLAALGVVALPAAVAGRATGAG